MLGHTTLDLNSKMIKNNQQVGLDQAQAGFESLGFSLGVGNVNKRYIVPDFASID